jgi:hypothetical protein
VVIQDATALTEIQQSWNGVEALRSKLQVSAFASVGVIGGTFPFTLANAAHNLPFIHAYAVLNDALKQLADGGRFTCKSIFLGELLKKSETVLPWQDFALISVGVGRRNDVAHRGQLLDRGDCWKYVDAVKAELSAWGII